MNTNLQRVFDAGEGEELQVSLQALEHSAHVLGAIGQRRFGGVVLALNID